MIKSNKVVIIGGTSGIGLATAHYLKDKGYEVIVTGRRSLTLEGIETFKVDVRSEASIAELFNVHLTKHNDINALIYATGITSPAKCIDVFDNDLWIAATSIQYELTLITRDKGFLRLQGIENFNAQVW